MKKNTLCLTALAPVFLALGGCSVLGVDDVFNQESVQYESSSTRANLEVPPDMTPIGNDGRFDVPTRPSVVTASGEVARRAQQEASDANGATPASQIVASTVVAKVMRDGQQRWLRVNAPAEDLWVVVQDFWSSVGLTVREQNARTGFMETNWAENKARLPQDFIRGTIGKVLDFVYSTSERDQYRVRLERTEDGNTDVFLTHRSMVEVVKGKEGDTTIWQPGPTDPTLEAEMLQRLAVYIDAQFNPDAKPVDKEQIAKELQNLPTRALSEIERAADGTVSAVVINEAFDRAWRSVGLVIDRMGFELTDRDRAAGYYVVRYLDQKYEEAKKEERGWFENVFGSDTPVDAPSYRIVLSDEGSQTRLTVVDAEGNPDKTGVAPTILTLLAEQLR